MSHDWIYQDAEEQLLLLLQEQFRFVTPWMVKATFLGIYLGILSVSALILIWLERKISARIQQRTGPMFTGPSFLANGSMWTGGLFQTLADAIKLLLKELIIPDKADKAPFVFAPMLIFAVCVSGFLVIPFGAALSVVDLNIGLLYVIGMSSLTVLSILMAGWSSNNKYSLLGGLRSASQMLSYEVPLLFALLGPVLLAGTLSMQGLVEAQRDLGCWYAIPSFIGFVVYYIASIAEVNRPPFDIPEAESELVAGYVSEYSGMMFAMFFLAEFCNMFLVCSVAATVFLGGWSIPWVPIPDAPSGLYQCLSIVSFFAKTYFLILIMMWVRWTFPRVRPDHLMNFGWKFLLPLAFVNLAICIAVATLQVQAPLSFWQLLLSGLFSLGLLYAFFVFYRKDSPVLVEGSNHA